MKKITLIAIFSRHGRQCKYALGGVFTSQKLRLTILAGTLILSSCFSPYTGDEGSITIHFGSSSRAVYPGDGSEFLPYLEHQITLTGPSTIKRTVKGSGSIKLNVPPGTWIVNVDDTCGGIPFASGSSPVIDVKAGETIAVPIHMNPVVGTTFYTVNNDADWVSIACTAFPPPLSGENCIILTGSFITTSTANFSSAGNVTILGNGNTITYNDSSNFYFYNGGQSVTIKDVNIKGNTTNTSPLIFLGNGVTFTMQGNSSIFGNGGPGVKVDAQFAEFIMDGGRIYNNGANGVDNAVSVGIGSFTMNGGTISGNTGSGVFLNDAEAVFIMNGGTISGNSGGVAILDGTFTMKNGTISGNTATDGGGVYIANNGTFNMEGGTISKNTAANGGGVYVYGASGYTTTFIMSGGTISNNTVTGFGHSLYVKNITYCTVQYGNSDFILVSPTAIISGSDGYVNGTLVGKK